MAVSGACALAIGLAFGAPAVAAGRVALVWGASVVADSAQFSTMVTELRDPAYVGTALTLQLATPLAPLSEMTTMIVLSSWPEVSR